MYEKRFSCAHTKTEAIVLNVLYPFMEEEVEADLNECNFMSLSTDTSNHHDLKLVPVMVKYFMPYEGVKIKLLEFKELPGETAKLISNHLKEDQNHLKHKVIAFGSDKTNSMMSKQGGKNNVLHLFKEDVGSDVIGIGCVAHIIHNTAQLISSLMMFRQWL
ncbi:hypothetical protein J437_LFUL007306 [Ladona fulva]|uniref:DUF4371 domain-containing protein n=1 Tax=Ladona fulva TaxID=123851 RepID=A0A8K0KRF3_LADFU|nr:hypothetical protein J437_LFUL007306 [Ladona fulva]